MNYIIRIAVLSMVLMLSGCAANKATEQVAASNQAAANQGDPRDPIEPVNRAIWDFNWQVLDKYLLRPVTVAYTTIMPDFARKGLLNAAENLEEPGIMVNNFLQGKGSAGLDSLSRFLFNSTFGLLGFIDVASSAGIERQEEGFDEVLGVWGVGNGPFLMLPAAGPNDARGVVGTTVDNMYYPMAVLNSNLSVASWAINILEARAGLMAVEAQIAASPDDYAFVKNVYFQNKAFEVNDGEVPTPATDEQQLDDFEDFESMLGELEENKEEKKGK